LIAVPDRLTADNVHVGFPDCRGVRETIPGVHGRRLWRPTGGSGVHRVGAVTSVEQTLHAEQVHVPVVIRALQRDVP